MPSREILERLLWSAAEHRAARLNFAFSDDSASNLRTLIHAGVSRMEQEGVLESQSHVGLAQSQIEVFTTRMAMEAHEKGLARLQERTFQAGCV